MSSTNDQQGMAKMENGVRVQIDGMMRGLPPEPSSWPKIFQVPPYFRKLKEEAYEPKFISIGLYHHQKDHLKAMETLKVGFLKDLLQRRNENSAQRYVEVMTGMMGRARKCYSESIVISDDVFLKMMVLDGCFFVELLNKIDYGCQQDSMLNVDQIVNIILDDLRLVENQLPLFVLWELFGEINEDPRAHIFYIFRIMFEQAVPGFGACETVNENSIKNAKHLVDLLRTAWLPSKDLMREYKNVTGGRWSFIRSATELREAGIKFEKVEGASLFDVKFVNGKLYIPVLIIADRTAGLFRNIIACEQFNNSESPRYLSEYCELMDCLIRSGKDVELLCHEGIIENWLGTDEAVAEMFNTLGTEVIIESSKFFYAKLFNDVNICYNKPCNRRMASLRHDYFNTPWALISFLAAAFLLLLTLLQTTFTIFPRS